MLKKIISLLIILTLIVSIMVFYLYTESLKRRYKIYITRIYSSDNELQAIIRAESFNYTDLLDIPPFYPSENITYSKYVWANYINNYTVAFYKEKIDYLKRTSISEAKLNYTASSEFTNTILNVTVLSVTNYSVLIQIGNRTIELNYLINDPLYGEILAVNVTGEFSIYMPPNLSSGIQWQFTNVYCVWMKLSYWEYHEPLAAYGSEVSQFIILDENMNLLLVLIYNKIWAIASNSS